MTDVVGGPMKASPSLAVVYFGVGFTLMAAVSMVALTALGPLISGAGARRLAMFAPLLLGVPFGARVAWVGMREGLTLGAALRRAVGLGRRTT